MLVFAAPIDPASLPTAGGSYVLELCLDRELVINPGRLGTIRLGRGRLRYYGSARGPGGVRARVARHLRDGGRRHWHVDWLLARAPVRKVRVDLEAGKCELVRRDLDTGRWAVAATGFGSSDLPDVPGASPQRAPPLISGYGRLPPGPKTKVSAAVRLPPSPLAEATAPVRLPPSPGTKVPDPI